MLDLGPTFLTIVASYGALVDAQKEIGKYQAKLQEAEKAGKKFTGAQEQLNQAFSGMTKTAQLVLGPLSGVASRLGNIQSILTSGTIALASFTVGLSSMIGVVKSSLTSFRSFESSLSNIGGLLAATGKNASLGVKEVSGIVTQFARQTATPLKEAMDTVQTALTFKGIDQSNLLDFLNTAKGLSKAYGDNLTSAVTALGKGIENPAQAIESLAEKGLVSFNTQQKEMLKLFTQIGDRGKVYALVMGQVKNKVGDVGKEGSGLNRAINNLNIAWEQFKIRLIAGNDGGTKFARIINQLTAKINEWAKAGGLADRIGLAFVKTLDMLGSVVRFVQAHMDDLALGLKIYASSKIVGFAISSTLGFIKALKGVGQAMLSLRFMSLATNPIALAGLAAAGAVGGLVAFGAATADTGNIFTDVFASILALIDTFKQRFNKIRDVMQNMLPVIKDFAKQAYAQFISMFPDFASAFDEGLIALTNFGNDMLESLSRITIAGAVLWDRFTSGISAGFEEKEIQQKIERTTQYIKDFKEEFQLSPGDVMFLEGTDVDTIKAFGESLSKLNAEGGRESPIAKQYAALIQMQDEAVAKQEEFNDKMQTNKLPLLEAIAKAQSEATPVKIEDVVPNLKSTYNQWAAPLINPLLEAGQEAGVGFWQDFENNLQKRAKSFSMPVQPELDYSQYEPGVGQFKPPEDWGMSLGVVLGSNIGRGLTESSKTIADNWAKQLVSGEHTKWSDIGRSIAESILSGLLQQLIVDEAVNDIKKVFASMFNTTSGPAAGASVGVQDAVLGLTSIFGGGVSGAGADLDAAFATNPSIFGSMAGTAGGLSGASTNVSNTFNIVTQNATSFTSASGRIDSDMRRSVRTSLPSK